MELVEGPTLADRIAKGPIPIDEALPIAKQIAEALEAAHEAGVIHRDLKPANIKVRKDGTVKVLDFGLAKVLDTTPEGDPSQSPTLTAAATQMGVILGTAAYMSPEQARGKTVDKRADVWAFGAVLYDMLTGTRAFDGEDVTQTLARVVERDPNWERLPAGAPPVLTALLRACLTKDPKHRLRDVGEFRLAIEGGFDIVQHQTPQAGPASRSPFWRHPALGWGAAAAVATGMLVLRTASVPVDDTLDGVTRQSAILLPEGVDWPVIGSGIAVSPDGRSLVFELWRNGVSQLYRRPIDRLGDPEPIPDTERAIAPFFAPDGQSLAYFRDGELQRMSIYGGRPTTICDTPLGTPSGVWTRDGTIIVGSTDLGLMRVSSAGGAPESLTSVDAAAGERGHVHPLLLPGGDGVLFSVWKGSPDQSQIAVLSLESGRRTSVVDGHLATYTASGHLLYHLGTALWAARFDAVRYAVEGNPIPVVENVGLSETGYAQYALSPAGTLVYVPPGLAPSTRLVEVDPTGRVVERSEVFPGLLNPVMSPTARRVAFAQDRAGAYSTTILDLERQVPERLAFEGAIVPGAWSPDGRRLGFGADRAGGFDFNLYVGPPSGAALRQLTSTTVITVPTSWSPDGRFLVFVEPGSGTGNDIWVMPMEGEGEPRSVLSSEHDETQAVIAPNGRLLAYRSDRSGQHEVYVASFPELGDDQRQASVAGGMEPRWSTDGAELYYRTGTHMMSVPVFEDPDMRLGSPEVLFRDDYRLIAEFRNAGYDVMLDGRFLMVEEEASPGFLWIDQLPRRAGTSSSDALMPLQPGTTLGSS